MGKYQRHSPFYCQEDCYNWQGLHISRQDMCNWQQKVFDRLKPLKELLDRELKKGRFLMFDETPLEVLKYSEAEARKEYWGYTEGSLGHTEKYCLSLSSS